MVQNINIPISLIDQTLIDLKTAGTIGNERVVIWLGKKGKDSIEAVMAIVPDQIDGPYSFTITQLGMSQIFQAIRENRLAVVAQFHSHPKEAFHSAVDDRRAIVRHEGALSFVLPDYAQHTSIDSLKIDLALYSLDQDNEWLQISSEDIQRLVNII